MNPIQPSAVEQVGLVGLCRVFTENSPFPMAALEGRTCLVRHANLAFCRLMEQPLSAILGQPVDQFLTRRAEGAALFDRVLRTGSPAGFTETVSTESHSGFWSYTMWPLQTETRTLGVMIQVTEATRFHESALAMNQALVLGAVHQHELTEAAEETNAQLRREIIRCRALETR